MPIDKKIIRLVNGINRKGLTSGELANRTDLQHSEATLLIALERLEACQKTIRGALSINSRSRSFARDSKPYRLACDFYNKFQESIAVLSDDLYIARRAFRIRPKATGNGGEANNHPADLIHEIAALDKEFPYGSGYSLTEKEVWVITPEITLTAYDHRKEEDISVYLGQFKIALSFADSIPRYKITCVQGLTYASRYRSQYIHPHIDNHLCTGEGGSAIERALQSNRIIDFFEIVTAILSTYNHDSPYFSLIYWEQVPCSGCNGWHDEDSLVHCEEHPDNRYCEHCRSSCTSCSEVLFGCCVKYCPQCDLNNCENCIIECKTDGCEHKLCKSCSKDGLCFTCFRRTERNRLRREARKKKAALKKEEEAKKTEEVVTVDPVISPLAALMAENPGRSEEYIRELLELPPKE